MENEVIEVISKVSKVPAANITLNSDLFDDLKIDSLLAVEILSSLDRKYGLDIPEDRLVGIRKVNDIVLLVKEFLKK